MAYIVTDIDKYLKGKKYGFYQLITDPEKGGVGAKDERVIRTKKLWQAAEDAKGTNAKIEAFKALQKDLNENWFTDKRKERLELINKKLADNNATPEQLHPDNKEEYDVLNKLFEYADFPTINENENLDVKQIISDNYKPSQMKALAAQYGYDYDDKAERAEFLNKAEELIKNEDIKKIWNDDIYTSIVTPIAKEYAQKNYDKIEDVGDLAPALAADVGVNTLMAGIPGSVAGDVIGKGMVSRAVDNIAAPVARAGANMLLNKESAEDAAKNMVSEVATNYATPWLLRGATRKLDKYAQKELQKAETQVVNGTPKQAEKAIQKLSQEQFDNVAEKARAIEDKLKSGIAVMDDKGNIFKFSKDGKLLQGSEKDIQLGYLPYEDFDFYLQNKNVMRGPKWGPEGRNTTKAIDELLEEPFAVPGLNINQRGMLLTAVKSGNKEQFRNQINQARKDIVAKQIKENVKNNKPATSGINAEELAFFNDKKPKESFWNWKREQVSRAKDKITESTAGQAAAAYLTNLQGRSKWGGNTINTLATFIPGASEKIDLSVKERPDVENDPELQLLKHLYELNKKNPNLFEKPKLPEKWKDYGLEDIFGNKKEN